MNIEDLHIVRQMVETGGLINAFDGSGWVDLRPVLLQVIDLVVAQASTIDELEALLSEAREENHWLRTPANHHDGA